MSTSITEEKKSKTVKKVSSILITQAKPLGDDNPYSKFAAKLNIKVDFRAFIEIKGVDLRDFRKQKINIADFTAIIFTSKFAVDHFFRICTALKHEVPADLKYFCVTEQTANYLQRYIVVRKRKVFFGNKTAVELIEILKKHKTEKFLFPCSNLRTADIPDFLANNSFDFVEAELYQTVAADLSDLSEVKYDVLAFFSPSGVDSLFSNFPDFKQNDTRIAAFGPTTAKAVTDSGLVLDIQAPTPNAQSLTGAIELYLKKK